MWDVARREVKINKGPKLALKCKRNVKPSA